MANTSAERDFDRAKDLRKLRKGVTNAAAVRAIEAASARLEARGARKLNKLGRRAKRGPVTQGGGVI